MNERFGSEVYRRCLSCDWTVFKRALSAPTTRGEERRRGNRRQTATAHLNTSSGTERGWETGATSVPARDFSRGLERARRRVDETQRLSSSMRVPTWGLGVRTKAS